MGLKGAGMVLCAFNACKFSVVTPQILSVSFVVQSAKCMRASRVVTVGRVLPPSGARQI